MTSGIVLELRLRFHHHTPNQAAIVMPLHQPAVNQLRGNDLGWAAEEGVGQGWEMLGVREVGYKSRLEDGGALNSRKSVVRRGKEQAKWQ